MLKLLAKANGCFYGNGSESVPLGLFTFLTLLRMRGRHFALPGGDQIFLKKITKMQLVII